MYQVLLQHPPPYARADAVLGKHIRKLNCRNACEMR